MDNEDITTVEWDDATVYYYRTSYLIVWYSGKILESYDSCNRRLAAAPLPE